MRKGLDKKWIEKTTLAELPVALGHRQNMAKVG
jgi:hypothetical protein